VNPEWQRLCHGDDALEPQEHGVTVTFGGGRRQRVRIDESDGGLLVSAVIASPAFTMELEDPALYAWRRNCLSRLVGLRVDERGRLIGQAWVSLAGLDAHEFQLCVWTIAAECDRVEHLLTGRDVQ
jgi:hypothetical protein